MPVVMQLEALECGAACLTMVLAYYGKWIPLEQIRTDCGVSRDGSNAGNILKAARSHGLEAAGYRFEPEDLREEGSFPCIIHWNFNHFVVCTGFKGNMACLNDPARGSVMVTMEEFDRAFTGVCLMFEPGPSFVPGGKRKSILGFAMERLKSAVPAVIFVAVLLFLSGVLSLVSPGLNRVFMDRLLTGQSPSLVRPFFIFLFCFSMLQVILQWIEAVYSLRINGKLSVVGGAGYMWKVLSLPVEFFSQRMAGDIQQRQDSNENVAGTLMETVAPLFINTVMMLFYFIVMLRYSVTLAFIGLLSVVINIIMSRIISEKRINITRVQLRDEGKLRSAAVSGIEMIETIKASGAENGFFRRWAGYQASVNTQRMKYERIDQVLGLVPLMVNSATEAAIICMGIYLVMNGRFTVGMVYAFQGFLLSFSQPAMVLIDAGQTIQEMRTQMERIEDVMKYPSDLRAEEKINEPVEYDKLSGNLELKNVTFGYSKLAEPLIKDFDLSLKTGDRVAIVGPSGCGKSTVSKLISGLYKPWSGEILFDGKPIDTIDRSIFTGSLAVVDQDLIIFEDTIANNIRMWDGSIEDFEMIMAARDAHIHEDILQREGGYGYRISDGGRDFSGGQRQRLEIARILAQDPTIIIMDEATSALDAKTEYEVVKSIKERGITCIIVAHRLSTIRDCDEIIVMDRGRIIERGTHDELYAKNGYYRKLVSSE